MRTVTIYRETAGNWVCEDATYGKGQGPTQLDALRNWLSLSGWTVEVHSGFPGEIRITT